MKKIIKEYVMITLAIIIMVVGVYFFKFPNNFAFGGVTGYASIVSKVTGISSGAFTNIANLILLLIGFIFIGKSFGLKTIYASLVFTVVLAIFTRYFPVNKPLTDEPFLEMVLAVGIPSVATGILFNIGASSGGTDILAMILKKYTPINIGKTFLLVDVFAVILSFFVFGIEVALFSFVGLIAKSFVVDSAIESINLAKCFTIICDNPEPICDFIIKKLNRSATVYEAKGAFQHNQKMIILTTMKRAQAIKLRNYIRNNQPSAFMMITNSSEIIGKGFQHI